MLQQGKGTIENTLARAVRSSMEEEERGTDGVVLLVLVAAAVFCSNVYELRHHV